MLRTVLMAFFSLAVGYIILVVLIDGVLQDSFPAMIISRNLEVFGEQPSDEVRNEADGG